MIILYAMTYAFNNNYDLKNMQYNNNVLFYTLCMLNYIFQIMFYKCFILCSLSVQLHVSFYTL